MMHACICVRHLFRMVGRAVIFAAQICLREITAWPKRCVRNLPVRALAGIKCYSRRILLQPHFRARVRGSLMPSSWLKPSRTVSSSMPGEVADCATFNPENVQA